MITIEEGEIDEDGILENLRELLDKDWAWQLKKSDEYSYIVRFPPNRIVENLVIGKASVFDLNRPGVVGSLSVWNGEIEPIGSLTEVWVLIQGIPPKWVDWRTMCEVSSGLGRMIEVDWQTLFNSFFSTVRVKVLCKDPTKIPKERLFVFKDKIHLILFTPEGYEQVSNNMDDGCNKGGGAEKKEDESLEDDSPYPDNGGVEPKEGDKDKEQNQSNTKSQGSKSASKGGKTVKRALTFEDTENVFKEGSLECAKLLKAMELEEDDEWSVALEMDHVPSSQGDDDTCLLPEEWIYNLSEERKSKGRTSARESDVDPAFTHNKEEIQSDHTTHDLPSVEEEETFNTQPRKDILEKQVQQESRKSKKNQWGPIIPVRRSSRNVNVGKSMLEKAQEMKGRWNLEDKTGKTNRNPKISKSLLISVAKDVGLDLMDGDPGCIDGMLELDCSRNAASKLNCNIQECGYDGSLENKDKSDMVSTSRSSSTHVKNCQDGNPDGDVTDQELGWSKVENKKKNKKKK